MKFSIRVRGTDYSFGTLNELMARANEEKSGDRLAGLAAESELERVAAKTLLAEVPLSYIRENPAVPYERDVVTRVVEDGLDGEAYGRVSGMNVSELREFILGAEARDVQAVAPGLTPEMAAAVAKIMSNLDLILAASRLNVATTCVTTVGTPGTFSARLQPNHPADRIDGILATVREGLSYGVGDAVIGINPVDDTVPNIGEVMRRVHEFTHDRLAVPTQVCVLAHVSTQMEAVKNGAPVDMLFQSLAGTEAGNDAFGVTTAMLDDAAALASERAANRGPNRFYFETGQGSELSSDAHEGVDQVTLEARCYGLARAYDPFLVNTVVGFIGPEYLYDAKQVTRAGLEDHFMGKLLGLPMGVDVCYTNHMKADQNDLENLAVLLINAGANFFMGVPLGDDVMLNYQTTSFHDIAALRALTGKTPVPEFATWLEERGILQNGMPTARFGDPTIFDTGNA